MSVPGSKNSMVLIQKNVKKINKSTILEKTMKLESQASTQTTKKTDKAKPAEKKPTSPPKQDKKEVKK